MKSGGVIGALEELAKAYAELLKSMSDLRGEIRALRRALFRSERGSRLIKAGLFLIWLPEPTEVSTAIGACMIAIGKAKQAIDKRRIYIDDIPKALREALEETETFNL